MGPFLSGFADELVKIGAFPQQHQDQGAYDSSSAIGKTMSQTSSTALKGADPVQPKPVDKKRAPTPLTTPNHMVDYASRS